MDIGWNYRREHLRLQQRSHSVITDGGDQPNVVPPTAAIWYYFRETDYPHIKEMWEIGDNMAKGAAMMTDTEVTSRVLGSAWPSHMNKTVAETMHANIGDRRHAACGSEADQTLAKALQREAEGAGNRAADRRSTSCAAARRFRTRTSAAAARTTSATSRGTCRR